MNGKKIFLNNKINKVGKSVINMLDMRLVFLLYKDILKIREKKVKVKFS